MLARDSATYYDEFCDPSCALSPLHCWAFNYHQLNLSSLVIIYKVNMELLSINIFTVEMASASQKFPWREVTATHCNTLQHAVTYGHTLSHTASHRNTRALDKQPNCVYTFPLENCGEVRSRFVSNFCPLPLPPPPNQSTGRWRWQHKKCCVCGAGAQKLWCSCSSLCC